MRLCISSIMPWLLSLLGLNSYFRWTPSPPPLRLGLISLALLGFAAALPVLNKLLPGCPSIGYLTGETTCSKRKIQCIKPKWIAYIILILNMWFYISNNWDYMLKMECYIISTQYQPPNTHSINFFKRSAFESGLLFLRDILLFSNLSFVLVFCRTIIPEWEYWP